VVLHVVMVNIFIFVVVFLNRILLFFSFLIATLWRTQHGSYQYTVFGQSVGLHLATFGAVAGACRASLGVCVDVETRVVIVGVCGRGRVCGGDRLSVCGDVERRGQDWHSCAVAHALQVEAPFIAATRLDAGELRVACVHVCVSVCLFGVMMMFKTCRCVCRRLLFLFWRCSPSTTSSWL